MNLRDSGIRRRKIKICLTLIKVVEVDSLISSVNCLMNSVRQFTDEINTIGGFMLIVIRFLVSF
jgi:hypothetical protein